MILRGPFQLKMFESILGFEFLLGDGLYPPEREEYSLLLQLVEYCARTFSCRALECSWSRRKPC